MQVLYQDQFKSYYGINAFDDCPACNHKVAFHEQRIVHEHLNFVGNVIGDKNIISNCNNVVITSATDSTENIIDLSNVDDNINEDIFEPPMKKVKKDYDKMKQPNLAFSFGNKVSVGKIKPLVDVSQLITTDSFACRHCSDYIKTKGGWIIHESGI